MVSTAQRGGLTLDVEGKLYDKSSRRFLGANMYKFSHLREVRFDLNLPTRFGTRLSALINPFLIASLQICDAWFN